MIGPGPAIWLGDAVRVVGLLSPDDETTLRVLELLELREPPALVRPGVPRSAAPAPETRPARQPSSGRRRDDRRATSDAPPPSSQPRTADDAERRPPFLETLPGATPQPPEELPELDDVLPAVTALARLPPSDLLDPNRQRAIIGGLCGSPAPTGELDVHEVVDRIVSGRPLTSLPQLVRPTTRRGLQLLVDISRAMLPFSRDQAEVQRSIEMIAGPDGLEVVAFRGHPLGPAGAGSGPVWTWTPYQPPAGGLPVVALSDLGVLGPPAERSEVQNGWCRLAGLTREAGCPLAVLTPVPVRRVPRALRVAMDIVVWDRITTVRDAVAAARRSAGRSTRPGDRSPA